MVSSARPSVVVKIWASTMLPPGGGAGAGDAGQEPRVVGRDHGDRSHAMKGVGCDLRRQRTRIGRHRVEQFGVSRLPRRLHFQPVGRIVPLGVSVELRIGPAREQLADGLLSRLDAPLAVDRRMTAAKRDFGLPVERAQKLALPTVPDARSDGPNIGRREREQHLQALLRLHDRRQRLRRFRIEQVTALSHVGHDQMLLDEPRHALGVRGGEPQAQTDRPRDFRASMRMVGPPTFGDVMQERCEIKLGAMARSAA